MAPPPHAFPQGQPLPQVPQMPGLPGQQQQAYFYLPMPAGPTVVVQMPPAFDTLMAILRETRLAQLATVDQQRELMRYMQGLNGWLEQDVYNRQSELREVGTRLDQLRGDLLGMRAQAQVDIYEPSFRTTPPPPSESSVLSGPQMPRSHHSRRRTPPGHQIPPPHHFREPQMPQPQYVSRLPPGFQPTPTQPIIPPVIPAEYHTPTPTFTPVIPQMHQQQPPFATHHQRGIPVIPTGGFPPPGRMHSVPRQQEMQEPPVPFIPPQDVEEPPVPFIPPQHVEEPPAPFIPPPLTGSRSAGSLSQYSMLMQPHRGIDPAASFTNVWEYE